MINFSVGYARLDTLENAYKSLVEVGNNDQLVKKHQNNTLLKQKKQEHKERKLNIEEVVDKKLLDLNLNQNQLIYIEYMTAFMLLQILFYLEIRIIQFLRINQEKQYTISCIMELLVN